MAPTSSINVTLGCAITIWVYYHFQGIREQGVVNYIKHFWAPPGAPLVDRRPIMFPIEIISHTSRVMSLSLRLFGNIFGEELVILILFSIVPFLVPLPMMFLGLVTGGLQAFIFVLLSIIYLQGAVAVEHEHDDARARRAERQPRAGGGVSRRGLISASLIDRWFESFLQEALVVSKRSVLTFALMLVAGVAAPALRAGARRGRNQREIAKWSIITAGFALAFAAGFGALGQGAASARPPKRSRAIPARPATSAAR